MAKNIRYSRESDVVLKLAVPNGTKSGEVVAIGSAPLIGVAMTDADDSNNASVWLPGISLVLELPVVGKDGNGNSAVAIGDSLYLDGAEYNKDSTNGEHIGYALGVVSSGSTDNILVAIRSN